MTYFNTRTTMVAGWDASVSFTTTIDVNNFDNGAIEIVWSSLNAANGTVVLKGSISGSNYDTLSDVRTMVTASAFQLYGILEAGFEKIQVVYAAASNTAGTIDVYANRKSRR